MAEELKTVTYYGGTQRGKNPAQAGGKTDIKKLAMTGPHVSRKLDRERSPSRTYSRVIDVIWIGLAWLSQCFDHTAFSLLWEIQAFFQKPKPRPPSLWLWQWHDLCFAFTLEKKREKKYNTLQRKGGHYHNISTASVVLGSCLLYEIRQSLIFKLRLPILVVFSITTSLDVHTSILNLDQY